MANGTGSLILDRFFDISPDQSSFYKTRNAWRQEEEMLDDYDYNALHLARPLPKNLCYSNPNLAWYESRSMDFFVHRTARDWTGWQDAPFWNGLVLRASPHSDAIQHALIAISAFHESSEAETGSMRATQLRRLAGQQAQIALRAALTAKPSYSESLITSVVFFNLTYLEMERSSHHLLDSAANMLDELDAQAERGDSRVTAGERHMIDEYVRPLIYRLRSRLCQAGDLGAALRAVVYRQRAQQDFMQPDLPTVPTQFDTLMDARNSLNNILHWATRSIPAPVFDMDDLLKFHKTLNHLWLLWRAAISNPSSMPQTSDTQSQKVARKLLHAARLVGNILLETFHATEETAFDQYTADFEDVVRLVEESGTAANHMKKRMFGIDAGLSDLLLFVGSRCRDPVIRRRVMRLLTEGDRVEGGQLSTLGGYALKALIAMEEGELVVNSCHDIPESCRRRPWHTFKYKGCRKMRMFLVNHPYDPELGADMEDIWVSLPSNNSKSSSKSSADAPPLDTFVDLNVPDMICGQGQAAFLEDRKTRSYSIVYPKDFYFPIPRV